MSAQRIIGVCGFKNSGKTTLVEKLVRHITGLDYKVSTVKHAHHDFDIDHEGRDSFRHRKAGATEVAVVSQNRFAIMNELRGSAPPSLNEILGKLSPCDLVIVEGYKRDAHDKIEVRNLELSHPILAGDDPTIVAVAANGEIDASVPVFDRDDVAALAKFILDHCKLGLRPTSQELRLRRATRNDAEAIGKLTRQVYAKWIAKIGREPFPMRANYMHAVEHHWIDLREIDGELKGLIEMIPKADHLMIENIAIAESEQGKGWGSALMAHAMALAKASGLPEVRLLTNQAFDTNMKFYGNLGFEHYRSTDLPDGGVTAHFRKTVS